MNTNTLCDPYIWEHPAIIFTTSPFKPVAQSCASELVNQMFLIVLIFTAFGAVVSLTMKNTNGLLAGFVVGVLFSIPSFISVTYLQKQSENFKDADSIAKTTREKREAGDKLAEKARHDLTNVLATVDVIGSKNTGIQSKPYTTDPSARNPFMNVLIDELKYNPSRPRAASVLDPTVKVQLDDFFRTEFYSDPTDVFGRSQGQRQFITQPATSIPNDVESYQNWLYKIPGKTCKEGNPGACVPGTNGGAIPWLSK